MHLNTKRILRTVCTTHLQIHCRQILFSQSIAVLLFFHLMLSSAIIVGTYIKAINMKNEDEGMHYMHCDSALIE